MGLEHAETSGSFLKDIMHSGGGLGCSSKATIGEDALAPRDDMPRPTLSSEGGLMLQTSRGTGTGRDARFWRRGVGVGESESGVKSRLHVNRARQPLVARELTGSAGHAAAYREGSHGLPVPCSPDRESAAACGDHGRPRISACCQGEKLRL